MGDRSPGTASLRLDAAYCGLVAVSLAVFAVPLAEALAVPASAVLACAAATALWALAQHRAARGRRLRRWLRGVLVANTVAAGLITALAIARPWDVVSLLLAAVALEVAAFAVSQAVALRRPPHAAARCGGA